MKKSNIIAVITLFMLAVIPAVAAWSQLPTTSNFKFAAEPAHVVHLAPMTVTDTDMVTLPEVKILAPSKPTIAHKISTPITCQLHELIQQGSPTARFVKVCS